MKTLNLGILAHVDAGKTSLTERLLLAGGVIDQLGRVDAGTTQTDTLDLERQRGITIRSAVTSFVVGKTAVNLIDTPGHPDFIAEVERVLAVLDGAVLVISAVEGVQAQTRVLMRALRRLGIPTLVFVNKIDRRGARSAALITVINDRLGLTTVPLGAVENSGSVGATSTAYADLGPVLLDPLTALDDRLLADYLSDPRAVTTARLRHVLATQTRRGRVHPLFFGSALTGAGVDELISALAELLPTATGDADAPPAGTVFKVERGPTGERVAYVRMFAGALHTRDRIRIGTREEKVTRIAAYLRGPAIPVEVLTAGQIGQVWGLNAVQVGDPIGAGPTAGAAQFAPPSLESVVIPRRTSDRGRMYAALTQLAEQDPLIDLRRDPGRGEVSVSLYGEVQKEVITATLTTEYGVAVRFEPTTTLCIERLVGPGDAVEIIDVEPNPFLATVGLRLEPAAVGAGISWDLEVELGSMPRAFFEAIEATARETLREGLAGWPVPDCRITVIRCGYWPRQSHAHATFDKSMSSTGRDFRQLTPLVVMDALRRARTQVAEPIHRFDLEIPEAAVTAILRLLDQAEAAVQAQVTDGAVVRLSGTLPAARVHRLRQELPGRTSGEGLLDTRFDHYAPVRGTPPHRRRTEPDPLNRKEYLLRVARRSSPAAAKP